MSDPIIPESTLSADEIQDPSTNAGTVCPKCRAEYRPGFTTCSDCGVPLVGESPPPPSSSQEPATTAAPGLKCSQHPEIDAVAQCRGCSRGICSTCDFQISADLHFCPNCIENAGNEKISQRRKRLAIGGLAVAAYCTLISMFIFSGALFRSTGGKYDEQALGLLIMFLLVVPSLVGIALGFSAYERRLKNPPLVWTALVWNVLLVSAFLLLTLIGTIWRSK